MSSEKVFLDQGGVGTLWGAVKGRYDPLVVTFTPSDTPDTYTVDKTFDEVSVARQAGRVIVGNASGSEYEDSNRSMPCFYSYQDNEYLFVNCTSISPHNATGVLNSMAWVIYSLNSENMVSSHLFDGVSSYELSTKENLITAVGILKCGDEGVVAAVPGEDYIAEETDPTVPAWAKTPEKPAYTAAEVGAAEQTHTHTINDVSFLSTRLANKASIGHTHDSIQQLPITVSTVDLVAGESELQSDTLYLVYESEGLI